MDVELRSWQQDAMKYFESPTQRQVIWIQGDRGNEGKTWFQNLGKLSKVILLIFSM